MEKPVPVSASKLASKLDVSRQIIVGDVALLRAEGHDIVSTPRGYVYGEMPDGYTRRIACRPSDCRVAEGGGDVRCRDTDGHLVVGGVWGQGDVAAHKLKRVCCRVRRNGGAADLDVGEGVLVRVAIRVCLCFAQCVVDGKL